MRDEELKQFITETDMGPATFICNSDQPCKRNFNCIRPEGHEGSKWLSAWPGSTCPYLAMFALEHPYRIKDDAQDRK